MHAEALTVWGALSEPGCLWAWLGRAEGPPLGPDTRSDPWHEDQVCSEHEVLEWVPPRLLVLAWDLPGETPSRVQLAVDHDIAGTVVVLEHEGIEGPVACAAEWRVHLDVLAQHLRGSPRTLDDFWADDDELVQRYGPQRQQRILSGQCQGTSDEFAGARWCRRGVCRCSATCRSLTTGW